MLIYYLFILDFHSSTSATNIDQIISIVHNSMRIGKTVLVVFVGGGCKI